MAGRDALVNRAGDGATGLSPFFRPASDGGGRHGFAAGSSGGQSPVTRTAAYDRVLEGRFEVALPEKAALSRLALRESGAWQKAEVVELARARNVFEDVLHRGRDPILVENPAGNTCSAIRSRSRRNT